MTTLYNSDGSKHTRDYDTSICSCCGSRWKAEPSANPRNTHGIAIAPGTITTPKASKVNEYATVQTKNGPITVISRIKDY